jgi:hypothetical protein
MNDNVHPYGVQIICKNIVNAMTYTSLKQEAVVTKNLPLVKEFGGG